jgi:hypothetical protein
MKNLKLKAYIRFLDEIADVVEINFNTGVVLTNGYDYSIEKEAVDLMLFSELKDCDNIELYENDIIKPLLRSVGCYDFAIVSFVGGGFVAKVGKLNYSLDEINCEHFQKVGNTYLNPEYII